MMVLSTGLALSSCFRARLGFLVFVFLVADLQGQVRQNLQRYDPASRDRGKTAFGAACAFCHGANARGGEGGPDLLHSVVVLQDEGGTEFGAFLQKGRPE